MNTAERQLLMTGQPGTGKTTFLALLWLAILWGRAPRMELAHYQDDRSYMNRIGERLQACDPALHTEVGEDRDLALSLLLGDGREPALLRIPDLSGETWREATLDRQWPARIEQQVSDSRGLLLFLHARDVDAGATIGEVNELADSLEFDAVECEPDSADDRRRDEAEPPERAITAGVETGGTQFAGGRAPKRKHKPPTQVALVDALQLICEQRGPHQWRVALVISAWDLIQDGMTPEQFVTENLPLLVQYLDTNEDWLEVRIFGLSAQGGDFKDPVARAELGVKDTVERAIVRGSDGVDARVHDIVAWTLGRF